MDRLAQLRRDYLEDKEPKKFKELKESGELKNHCEEIGNQAQEAKVGWMKAGLRDYEAEEIAREMIRN